MTELVDKKVGVSIKKVSRLRFATLREVTGFQFFDLPKLPDIPPLRDDQSHVVDTLDRIDQLAFRFYGSPDLWWVIAKANNLRILPRDLKAGATLSIPTRTRVFTEILPLVT